MAARRFLFLLGSSFPALAEDGRGVGDLPIRIGGDYNYPPYEYLDADGLPTGYNVELTQAIARVMGLEINIQLSSWGEMRQALDLGQVDF